MKDLSKRLLASIDVHVISSFRGICQLYCHETEENIVEALEELKELGWIKISTKMVTVAPNKRQRVFNNLRRTKKQLYSQPSLIE